MPKQITLEEILQAYKDTFKNSQFVSHAKIRGFITTYFTEFAESLRLEKVDERKTTDVGDYTLESYSEKILDIVSLNVKKYREEKGLTQIQLALEIGMSGGAYLGRAELRKNNHHFNIKHLAKISKVLNIDIGKFFEV